MKRINMPTLLFPIFFCLSLFILTPSVVVAQHSAFAILQFDNDITIEVPRNWAYLDDNIKQHLNNSSEAIAKLSRISLNQKSNQILVAANAYTNQSKPSATLRLSVRPGITPTQSEMKQLSKTSKTELSEILAPVISETKRTVLNVEGVRSVRAIDARIEQSINLTCLFVELETVTNDGINLMQTYICPVGNKSVKLSTSYRKSEATIFKPVLKYVWNSLSVTN